MMMMVLCPKAGSWDFTPPGDEMSEVVSRCLPHRQLWVSNLSKVATQWGEVDSNPRPFGCKPQHIPLHHGAPLHNYYTLNATNHSLSRSRDLVSILKDQSADVPTRCGI